MEHIGNLLPKREVVTMPSGDPVEKKYQCNICMDGGWLHPLKPPDFIKPDYSNVVRCDCMKDSDDKDKRERMLRYCELPEGSEDQTFETFRAHNEDLKLAYQCALDVSNPHGSIRWLTLISPIDTGKSHLAKAICRRWLDSGIPARYVYTPDLIVELRSGYDKDTDYTFQQRLEFYRKVPMLVIDDLGTGNPTDWAMEQLISIINHRYEYELHLVVTTNYQLYEIPKDNEHRIASRLLRYSKGKVIEINAEEYRQYLKGENYRRQKV